MASFRDIVAERRKSGAGIGSSIGTAFTERAKEKLDPRNYLFSKGGMATALFPKLTGYRAKVGSEKIKRNIDSDKISAEPVVQRLDDLNMQFKIVSKNSMSLPLMARDMNVMRQNIVKLVKISGGTPATKADAFFLSANEREKAYEAQFGRKSASNSPTSARTNTEKSKSFLETLMGLGISDIIAGILKGGALVAITKGIGQYINDKTFRDSVNDTIDTLMKKIFGETWAKDLKTGLLTLGAGVLAAKLAMSTLEAAFLGVARSLPGLVAGALTSPVFIAALAAAGLTVYMAENFRGKEKDLNAAAQKGDIKAMQEEAQRQADQIDDGGVSANDIIKDRLKKANTPEAIAALKQLEQKEKDDLEYRKHGPKAGSMIVQTVKGKVDNGNTTQKFPVSNSPSQVSGNANARKSIEDYLGRAITDSELGLLFKATYAESSHNKEEYARVMAVILNRARKTNQTIEQVLYEENQFEAVTGRPGKRGPSANFVKGPDNRSLMAIGESTNLLSKVSKNLDSFSSANTKAYETEEKGRRVIADLKNAGGQQIGGTIFAENRYASSGKYTPQDSFPAMAQNDVNTGNRMNELSKEFERGIREGSGVTNVTNTTNNISKNGGDGGGAIASGSVYDSELAKMFFARPAIS
jgi:uncharacterized protein (DUF697 family)